MPTLVGATGFEHQVPNSATSYSGPFANIAAWAAGGGFTTVSPIDGNASLHLVGSAGSAYWIYNFVGTPNHHVAVCYVYLNSFTLPVAGGSLPLLGFNWNGSIGGGIAILPDGTFGYSLFNGGTTGPTAVANQLYRLEVQADVSTSTWTITGGIAPVSSVTDTTALTSLGTGTSTQAANPSAARIEVGSVLSNTFDALFDNLAWSYTAADYPIGPIQVRGYVPNAVGTHNLDASPSAFYFNHNGTTPTALTTSETTSFGEIDEIPTGSDSARIVVEPGSTPNTGGSATGAALAASISGTWTSATSAEGAPQNASGAAFSTTNAASSTPAKSGTSVLELSSFTGLLGTITALTVNVRAAASATGVTGETIKIDLYDGTTLIASGTAQTFNQTAYKDWVQSFSGVSILAANLRIRVTVARGNTNTTYTAAIDGATLSAVSYNTTSEPSASLYAEYGFADETTITTAPALVVVGVVPDLDSAITTTWRAELFDSVQGTNVEDIYNASISVASKTYQGKAFAQRPNSGGAWTLAALNGLRLRFGLSAVVDGGPRLDGAILEAVYPVATTTAVTNTQPAIARIQIVNTKTQTAVSRIQRVVTKTQSAVARIAITATKTQSAIARISAIATKTQLATTRITRVVTKTQSATARITTTATKTQSAVARISLVRTVTQNAVSRISKIVTKTQTAVANIAAAAATVTKTQSAIARVSVISTKTQSAIARISVLPTKTQTAVSRISRVGITKTQTSISRISKTVITTQTATANIRGLKTQTAIARISKVITTTQSAVSRIQKTVTKTQTATARIFSVVVKTQSAISRISNLVIKTQPAISRIQILPTKTQTAVARISEVRTIIQTAIARVAKIATVTQSATANIVVTGVRTKTQTATARVVTGITKTQPAIARISKTFTVTQSAISRIAVLKTKTQPAISRVVKTTTKTQTAVANIIVSGVQTKTQAAVARITKVVTKTQTAISRVQKTLTITQSAVSRVQIVGIKTQPAISRIQRVVTVTQSATAHVVGVSNVTLDARISVAASTLSEIGANITGAAGALQVATPITDISTGTWTSIPSGTLSSTLDELTPNDSDYIISSTGPLSPDISEVKLSGLTDPLIYDQHQVSYRYRGGTSGGMPIQLTVRLIQGTTEIASWVHSGITSTTIVQATQTLTTTQAQSITDYTDLRLRFEAYQLSTPFVVAAFSAERAAGTKTAATIQAITPASTTNGNNTLILIVDTQSTSSAVVSSVTDTRGNTWTVDQTNGGTGSTAVSICSTRQDVALLTPADQITVTMTGSTVITYWLEEFVGKFQADVSNANSGTTGTSLSTGNVTITTPTEFAISAFTASKNGAATAWTWTLDSNCNNFPTGSLPVTNTTISTYAQYRILTAITTFGASDTVSSNTNAWKAAIVAYKVVGS